MTLFDTLKTHDLRELLRSRNIPINHEGKTLAPWRGERTPSVHVYADHWHDYGSGERGDFLDWLERAENMDKGAARDEAARLIGYENEAPRTRQNSTRVSSDNTAYRKPKEQSTVTPSWVHELVTQAHAALLAGESEEAQTARAYFEGRGLGGLVEALHLGVVDGSVNVPQAGAAMKRYRGRAIIPTLEGERALWFKARDISGRNADELKAAGVNKYDGPSGSVPAPFNPVGLRKAPGAGFLVLTEGETDAASLLAAFGTAYPVMGLPGGNLPKGWGERLAGVPCYVATDPDKAGAQHAERIRGELAGLGVRCYLVRLERDLNELLLEHGEADFPLPPLPTSGIKLFIGLS